MLPLPQKSSFFKTKFPQFDFGASVRHSMSGQLLRTTPPSAILKEMNPRLSAVSRSGTTVGCNLKPTAGSLSTSQSTSYSGSLVSQTPEDIEKTSIRGFLVL